MSTQQEPNNIVCIYQYNFHTNNQKYLCVVIVVAALLLRSIVLCPRKGHALIPATFCAGCHHYCRSNIWKTLMQQGRKRCLALKFDGPVGIIVQVCKRDLILSCLPGKESDNATKCCRRMFVCKNTNILLSP